MISAFLPTGLASRPMCSGYCALMACLAGVVLGSSASATDADGAGDCQRTIADFGDAPEGIVAYPGVPGRFPTCTSPGPPGDQELSAGCPPISTAPGPTGFVKHASSGAEGANVWIGCHFDELGAEMGIDSEEDGKVNTPPIGISACNANVFGECIEFFGTYYTQDECFVGGGLDAGLQDLFTPLLACRENSIAFQAYSCAPAPRSVFVNVLVDMNFDGDWNDSFSCPGIPTCAYEWGVKNREVSLAPGCSPITVPLFVGPNTQPGWMRITLTDQAVGDDFPWAGSAAFPEQRFIGGETEDYPKEIDAATSSAEPGHSSWGRVKSGYR